MDPHAPDRRTGSASTSGPARGSRTFHVFMQMVADAGANGDLDLAEFTRLGLERLDAKEELEQEPNMPSAHLAALFDAQGPNLNCLTACAASSQAIGEATEIIRRGDADVMLSGGAHSMIHPFGLTGFNLLTSLSTRNDDPQAASRPFDADRDGFVLGEGAGMLVLEEHDRAVRRGADDRRRGAGLRVLGGRLPHHGHSPRGPRGGGVHRRGVGRRGAEPRPRSTTSTPTAPARRSTTGPRPPPSSRP